MNRKGSQKTARRRQDANSACQTHVKKRGQKGADSLDEERLKINLGHWVESLGGGVQAYQEVVDRLNELAGRNGNAWSWRYVASIYSGSEKKPGKKIMRVLALMLEKIKPREKQWFYFGKYHSVAAVYDKTLKREIIAGHMKAIGYKPLSFMKYLQLKKRATRRN